LSANDLGEAMAAPTIRFDLDLRESLGKRLQPEALVVQEDRELKMRPEFSKQLDPDNDHDAAYMALSSKLPLPLGRYLLLRPQDGLPYWIYQAVIHDLKMESSCRPGDVRRSLTAILADAERRELTSIAIESLGSLDTHGLTIDEMAEAFDSTIFELSMERTTPLRLTLLLDKMSQVEEVSHLLRSRVLRRARRSFRTVDGDAAVVEVLQGGVRLHFRFVPGSLSGYIVTRLGHQD
jgi:hypothetical protein